VQQARPRLLVYLPDRLVESDSLAVRAIEQGHFRLMNGGPQLILQHVYLRHQLPHFIVHVTPVPVGYDGQSR